MNFQTTCRICISNNLEMLSIFQPYNFSVDNCEIFKVIIDCASVQIQKCDGFSDKICLRCVDDLSRAYRFKKLCQESDYKFRNNLILSNELIIKNEEDPVISYGEIHNHINKNIEEKSENTNFEFIEVKQEQSDNEIRAENKSVSEPDSSRLCSALIQGECEEPSSSKKREPFKCDFCGKEFSKRDNFTKHIRFHTGEKPYKCKFCDKTFAQSSNLTVHTRIHTGEKRFNCDFCEKKFTHRISLTRHMRFHKGEQ